MFIQTVIQTLLKKRKRAERPQNPTPSKGEKELSPMAQSIMQKLAEYEKGSGLSPKKDVSSEDKSPK